MKIVRAAAILFLLIVAGGTLAESYQIRVTWTTNLRASYSLNSPVIGKALAGQLLQVVGRNNRWLKIERNNEIVWMADWVGYTRLGQQPEQPAPAANGQTPANVDNCCFVDRQCSNDQEWTDGYWAFQNNQCNAPAQSQPGTSPGQRTIHGIVMEGSDLFLNLMQEALDYAQVRSPQKWHDYILSAVDRLIEKDNPSFFGAALTAERTVLLTEYRDWVQSGTLKGSIFSVLDVLVHEACHIHWHEAGFEYIIDPGLIVDASEELACNLVSCELQRNIGFYENRSLPKGYCPIAEVEASRHARA
ncbi:MAG: SH3 domain-containing protein [Chloroflexi bacterium]|nr:SH3 domain-containing protein [Chloroflexota bacterium]